MDSFGKKKKLGGFRYFNDYLEFKKRKRDNNGTANEKSNFKFFDFSEVLNENSSLTLNTTFQLKSFQNLRKIQLKTTKNKTRLKNSSKTNEKNTKSPEKTKTSPEDYKQIIENARARLRRETPSLPKLTSNEEKSVNIFFSTPKSEKYVKFKKNMLLEADSFKKSWRFLKIPRLKDHTLEPEKSLNPSSPHTIQVHHSPKKLL